MSKQKNSLQFQRFELKYVIEEQLALGIRDCVRSYLDLDEHGATQPDFSYPIHSIYLDSPDLKLYHATINGDKNRYKLRLRFYENRPGAPVYFEIKQRMNNSIAKQRCRVRADAVRSLLAGQLPEPDHLASHEPRELVALQRFCHLMNELQARPRTHVAYRREAWISRQDNSVRVTLDRQIQTEPHPAPTPPARMMNPVPVFGEQVVLEIKFTGRFPDWFKELVRIFQLTQRSAAKYADGVTRLGEFAVAHVFTLDDHDTTIRQRRERDDLRAVSPTPGSSQPEALPAVAAREIS